MRPSSPWTLSRMSPRRADARRAIRQVRRHVAPKWRNLLRSSALPGLPAPAILVAGLAGCAGVGRAILIVSILFAAGCTAMQSATTIAPYTTNQQQRGALQALAQAYCTQKRRRPGEPASGRRPDAPFTTDGCSRWPDDGWVACCVAHDMAYWCGGSETDRRDADLMLTHCVGQRRGVMGAVMYLGVRVAGVPWLPTPWRWGYGWKDWPRGYDRPGNGRSVADLIRALGVPAVLEAHFNRRPRPGGPTVTLIPDPGDDRHDNFGE